MLEKIYKYVVSTVFKPYLIWYLKNVRLTKVYGFDLLIKPTVFHPKYFFSSRYLVEFVLKLNLEYKTCLELGCGSGILSLMVYQRNGIVTCSDINQIAIECTKVNFRKNFGNNSPSFQVIKSDLFQFIPKIYFDFIFINPPYFFEEVSEDHQLAWNCGKNGEYFLNLFSQLSLFIVDSSQVYMVLADNCDINRISEIAMRHSFCLKKVEEKKIKWEINYIYKIEIQK